MTEAPTHLPNDPDPQANPLEQRLREQHVDLYRQLVKLEEEASEAPAEVNDAETAQAVTTLAGALSKLERQFEKARVEAKEPFLMGSQTVDNTLGAPKRTLETRRKALLSRVNAHNDRVAAAARAEAKAREEQARWDAEEARRAAEAARAVDSHQEADQLAQDAAQVDAQADALAKKVATTQTASVKTESGSTAYQVRTPAYRIPDGEALKQSLGPLAVYLGKEAIAAALQRAAKATPTPDVPGVEFYIHTESRVRTTQGA